MVFYLVVDHVRGGDEGAPKAVVVVVEVVVVVVPLPETIRVTLAH